MAASQYTWFLLIKMFGMIIFGLYPWGFGCQGQGKKGRTGGAGVTGGCFFQPQALPGKNSGNVEQAPSPALLEEQPGAAVPHFFIPRGVQLSP
jgi:hypothetical protein